MKLNSFGVALICLLATLLTAVPASAQFGQTSATVSTAADMKAVHPGDKATVAVIVDIRAGLHAQSATPTDPDAIPFTLSPDENSSVTFGPVEFPKGEVVHYATLGTLNVYRGWTVARVSFTVKSDAKPGPLTIAGKVGYQACNDTVCFQPEHQKFAVTIQVVPATDATQANADFNKAIHSTAAASPATQAATQPAGIANNWAHRHGNTFLGIDIEHLSVPVAFAAAFLIGIFFNAMPCVLPVLPLKIMGFYEVSQHDRKKCVLLGGVFSAGLIASFAVLAVLVVGLHTFNWGGLFQLAWFNATISIVLVAMAISTFGFFTINVPTALYSFTPRHDTYVGNFLFGILTAALSTPCTFGMFVGLLAWALKEPSWVGVSAVMMVGVGMAFPYFVLSAFPELARKFPRTGPWAEVVKQMMGFLLLATAVYFAQPFFQSVLSSDAFWWTLFGVIAAGGLFLIVRSIQLSKNALPRAICFTLAVLLVAPSAYLAHRLTEKPYPWLPFSPQALAAARAAGKTVVIDFTASWCGNCHYVEATALHDSDVVNTVHKDGVVMLKADVTNQDAAGIPLLSQLNPVGSIPLTAVYLPHASEPRLLDGIYSGDDLVDALTER